MTLTSKKIIADRYVLRQSLGRGATSEVFRATDELLKREVALKIYQPQDAWTARDTTLFLKEAKMAASLNHKNLAKIYAIGLAEDAPFMVMELVEGKSLASHLASEGPMPVVDALEVLEQICAAAQYLHDQGLIHRDIKPDNIMLSNEEGRLHAKLVDLGLVKNGKTNLQSQTVTAPGTIAGTPSYMSPEQLCGQPMEPRSDIFALGAVLYEAVTGQKAFPQEEAIAKMVATVAAEPLSMAKVAPQCLIPPAVENVAFTCLSKEPARRFESAAQLAEALRAIRMALIQGTTLPRVIQPKPANCNTSAALLNARTPRPRLAPWVIPCFALSLALLTSLFLSSDEAVKAAVTSFVVDANPWATERQRFETHLGTQVEEFDLWQQTRNKRYAESVISEGLKCLRSAEIAKNPMQEVEVELRSGIVNNQTFSDAEINHLSARILAAAKKTHSGFIDAYLKEAPQVARLAELAAHLRPQLPYRILRPPIAELDPKLGLEQARLLGQALRHQHANSTALAYFDLEAADCAWRAGNVSATDRYLKDARLMLSDPTCVIPSEFMLQAWLRIGELSYQINKVPNELDFSSAEEYVHDKHSRAWLLATRWQCSLGRPSDEERFIATLGGDSAEDRLLRAQAEMRLSSLSLPDAKRARAWDFTAIRELEPLVAYGDKEALRLTAHVREEVAYFDFLLTKSAPTSKK